MKLLEVLEYRALAEAEKQGGLYLPGGSEMALARAAVFETYAVLRECRMDDSSGCVHYACALTH